MNNLHPVVQKIIDDGFQKVQERLKKKYDYVGPLVNGRAIVGICSTKQIKVVGDPIFYGSMMVARFGYVDYRGKEVVPPIYEKVENFHEGFGRVSNFGTWGFIDKTGKEITTLDYVKLSNFGTEEVGNFYGFALGIDRLGSKWLINTNGDSISLNYLQDKHFGDKLR